MVCPGQGQIHDGLCNCWDVASEKVWKIHLFHIIEAVVPQRLLVGNRDATKLDLRSLGVTGVPSEYTPKGRDRA